MRVSEPKDKFIKSSQGGAMSESDTKTCASTKDHSPAPQFSGAKGAVEYKRMSALNKSAEQNALPGGDQPMPVIRSVNGAA